MLIIFILGVFTFALCDEVTFRNMEWGTSIEEVKSLETAELVNEGEGMLMYKATVGGLDTIIGYAFTEDQLWKGMYLFQEEHSNNNLFLDDFEKIKNILEKKYGTPTSEGDIWRDYTYRDTPDKYGLAICVGDLEMYAEWEKEDVTIQLMLSGDNYKISHSVAYFNEELQNIKIEKTEKTYEADF